MILLTFLKERFCRSLARATILISLIAFTPGIAISQIVWNGDFETGDFNQWHKISDIKTPNFSQVPTYGLPLPYGDGSLLEIVSSPVRQGRYAAKYTVKNSANGSESRDCDVPFPKCSRRRTELTAQSTLPSVYDALPYLSERWISVSHFVPSDWNDGGSGWGPILFQIKPLNEQGLSHMFAIELSGGNWTIRHSWSAEESVASLPWQYKMYYAGNEGGKPYPSEKDWPDGLKDFPDAEMSQAALRSVNKGGWTDWIIHMKVDARGALDGGGGFLTVWKREDSGPWVELLNILPRKITRGGMTFDRGIGFKKPSISLDNGGFGIKAGMYMDKGQVWALPDDRVIYNDNIKVGDKNATFAAMSPDGSSPGSDAPVDNPAPKPPTLTSVR